MLGLSGRSTHVINRSGIALTGFAKTATTTKNMWKRFCKLILAVIEEKMIVIFCPWNMKLVPQQIIVFIKPLSNNINDWKVVLTELEKRAR